MFRELFRAAYRARNPAGVERTVAGVRVRLPAAIARGVPSVIHSEILAPFLEAARGAVVYDVGANVGVWTALALARGAKAVIAIEPSIACIPLLGEIRDLYHAPVIVVLAAAGDGEGLGHLAVNGPTDATNHLASDGAPILTTRLDGLAQRTGFEPDLVKVDVEGAEVAVLRGMSRLTRWPTTLVELHWARVEPNAMLATGHRFTTVAGQPLLTAEQLRMCNAVRAH